MKPCEEMKLSKIFGLNEKMKIGLLIYFICHSISSKEKPSDKTDNSKILPEITAK